MEQQKIMNMLYNATNQSPKFRTNKIDNDKLSKDGLAGGAIEVNAKIKFMWLLWWRYLC